MIYTVTFNPALDYVMFLKDFKEGETNRSAGEEILYGGKGINVSVVLNELGIKSTALGFIAGFTGDELEKKLKDINIFTDFVKLSKGLTRINIKLKGKSETEINAAGPEISENELDLLFKKLDKLHKSDTLILSGSVPSSLPRDIYEKILFRLKEKQLKVVVDATGDLLLNTLKYKPFLIKPNKAELEEIEGKELCGNEDIISAALSLKEKGAVNVLVSLGEKGALLIDEFGKVHTQEAFNVKAVNTVGSGDSMIAGFLAGCERDYGYALKLGSAAGAATASLMGLADKNSIFSFL